MSDPAVWLIIGVQAAGKSTTADLLARQFERGVHVRGGEFYRWAVTGWVHMDKGAPAEAVRHIELRYRLSATVAAEYASAGFTVVAQDNIYGEAVTTWLRSVAVHPVHLVVLRPRVDVVARRDAERKRATGKVAYRPGSYTIAELDAALDDIPRIGLWLDTSDQTPDETVAEIQARRSVALVEPGTLARL